MSDWLLALWYFLIIAFPVLTILAMRVARWHDAEAAFWTRISTAVLFKPELDEKFRPLLIWAQTHEEPWYRKVRGWTPPDQRKERDGT